MIFTVNGPIEKEQLGITLGHEHFKWEYNEEYTNQMYFDKKYDEDDIKTSLQAKPWLFYYLFMTDNVIVTYI